MHHSMRAGGRQLCSRCRLRVGVSVAWVPDLSDTLPRWWDRCYLTGTQGNKYLPCVFAPRGYAFPPLSHKFRDASNKTGELCLSANFSNGYAYMGYMGIWIRKWGQKESAIGRLAVHWHRRYDTCNF